MEKNVHTQRYLISSISTRPPCQCFGSYLILHSGNAVQTAYLLGLGKERKGEVDSFQAETRRRRYWACYLVNCHASQPLFAHEPSESTLNLPLPWPEKEFDDGVLRSKLVSLGSGQSNNSVFCELIRAMTFW
jgi:hypothetical protein